MIVNGRKKEWSVIDSEQGAPSFSQLPVLLTGKLLREQAKSNDSLWKILR